MYSVFFQSLKHPKNFVENFLPAKCLFAIPTDRRLTTPKIISGYLLFSISRVNFLQNYWNCFQHQRFDWQFGTCSKLQRIFILKFACHNHPEFECDVEKSCMRTLLGRNRLKVHTFLLFSQNKSIIFSKVQVCFHPSTSQLPFFCGRLFKMFLLQWSSQHEELCCRTCQSIQTAAYLLESQIYGPRI